MTLKMVSTSAPHNAGSHAAPPDMGKITLPMLKQIRACMGGREWFEEAFPTGGTWAKVIQRLKESMQHSLAADDLLASQLYSDWAAWLGIFCPAGVTGSTWQARLALQRNEEDRARLGCYCPAEVPGATLKARLDLQTIEQGKRFIHNHYRWTPDGQADLSEANRTGSPTLNATNQTSSGAR